MRAREQEQTHSRGDDAAPGAGERDLCERGHGVRGGELQLEEEVVRREDEAVHQRDRGLCARSEISPVSLSTSFAVGVRHAHCPATPLYARRPRTSGEVMPLYRPTKRSSRTIVAIAPNVVSYFPAIAGLWNRTLTAARSRDVSVDFYIR